MRGQVLWPEAWSQENKQPVEKQTAEAPLWQQRRAKANLPLGLFRIAGICRSLPFPSLY
jgi:hypothetical protein